MSKEKLLEGYLVLATIECTNIIIKQMKGCICKI